MNTTDINNSMFPCHNSWSSYVTLGLNFIIIILSIGKQLLNKKNYNVLTGSLKANASLSTEQAELVQLNIPENLKASVKQE